MHHFLVVMGYGIVLDSPLGESYLPQIARFIDLHEPNTIIACGGETQQQTARRLYPRPISEAEVMADWFWAYWQKKQRFPIPICIEKSSFTTTENIRNAAKEIRRFKIDPEKVRITIFCEAQRALKVILLSRFLMLELVQDCASIQVQTVNWERANPFRELKTTVATWLDLNYPSLGIGERESRHRRARAHAA